MCADHVRIAPSIYLKPGTTAPWKAIDVSIGSRGFSAIAKGSAADVMAQLACGPAAFKPDVGREPSLEALVQRWND